MSILELGQGSISPGQSQSFTHLFSGGYSYNIEVLPLDGQLFDNFMELHLKVYSENGQKVGDDVLNMGPRCYLNISPGEPLKLKIAVSRDMNPNSRSNDKIGYKVIVYISSL